MLARADRHRRAGAGGTRPSAQPDHWHQAIGPEYVEMAFRWVKEADPASVLIFSDASNESPRDEKTARNLEKMVAPAKEDVLATMQRFADLGVRIQITEFDGSLTRLKGTQAERWSYQAQLYRDMLEACLETGVCDSLTTWGVSDSTSWITCLDAWCQTKEPDADPLMFDKDFRPKPAYWAVRNVFLGEQEETYP